MDVFDKKKIGTCVAWSGDHFVYEYGENHVLKTSKMEYILGGVGREKSMGDYETCVRYFSAYVLPTTFLQFPKGARIAKLQRKLVGRPLVKGDMKDLSVRSQLVDIVGRYQTMHGEGKAPLDLIGTHGLLLPRLYNIFLAEDRRLYLIDTTLIELDVWFLRPLVRLVRWYAILRQTRLLAEFLKE